jgi:hypothetical protein
LSSQVGTPIALQGHFHEERHRKRLTQWSIAAGFGVLVVLGYGLQYYLTSAPDRPYDPRHQLLRPGGRIGMSLGIFGVFLFLLLFLYPIRRRLPWLSKIGDSRHWLDFHILIGLTAPAVIALHASFKFGGLAGAAYWVMFSVVGSGFVGRYIYSQIPRRKNSTEHSIREARILQESLTARLAEHRLVRNTDILSLFELPSLDQDGQESALSALFEVLWSDFCRPFRVARVRRQALRFWDILTTLGGFLRSRNRELERVVAAVRERARLSKKLLFLTRSQQILSLWHVVHRPLSYSFAVLALVHIVIALIFGVR